MLAYRPGSPALRHSFKRTPTQTSPAHCASTRAYLAALHHHSHQQEPRHLCGYQACQLFPCGSNDAARTRANPSSAGRHRPGWPQLRSGWQGGVGVWAWACIVGCKDRALSRNFIATHLHTSPLWHSVSSMARARRRPGWVPTSSPSKSGARHVRSSGNSSERRPRLPRRHPVALRSAQPRLPAPAHGLSPAAGTRTTKVGQLCQPRRGHGPTFKHGPTSRYRCAALVRAPQLLPGGAPVSVCRCSRPGRGAC